MSLIENLPNFVTNPWFIGVEIVVVLVIIGGVLWRLHKKGKLPF